MTQLSGLQFIEHGLGLLFNNCFAILIISYYGSLIKAKLKTDSSNN